MLDTETISGINEYKPGYIRSSFRKNRWCTN